MRDLGVWITCVQFFSAGLYIFFFRPAVGEIITWIKIIFSSDLDSNEGCKILSGQSSWSYFKRGFTGFFYWLIYHKFVPHTWIFKTIYGILSPIYLNFRDLMYTMMIMIVWRPQWVWWALWEIVLAESRRRWSYLLLLTDVIMQDNAEKSSNHQIIFTFLR